MLDAVFATTVPIYRGLEPTYNVVDCTLHGLVTLRGLIAFSFNIVRNQYVIIYISFHLFAVYF